MRIVANHAGAVKEIARKFDKLEFNLQPTKPICKSEPETLIPASSIQSNSQNTQLPGEAGSCNDEDLEEIRDAIADAPFMQDTKEQEFSPPLKPLTENKFSAAVVRTILERLQDLGIPPTTEVRSMVQKTKEAQLERNVLALEEEAVTKGLHKSFAAFKYFVSNNCQPCNDRQSWWNRVAVALGRERRDHLIQSVTEYLSAIWVMFTNG